MKVRCIRNLIPGLVVGGAVVLTPLALQAEDIAVSPTSWDYGSVELGSASQTTLRITDTETTELTIFAVSIVDDPTGAFRIVSPAPPPSVTVGPGYQPALDVVVEFAPTVLGSATARLEIRSNAEGDEDYFVPFAGTGIATTPGQMMADLLAFLETSVAAGTLTGVGPGESAPNRLNAFRNKLKAAAELISSGDSASACEELRSALAKADGQATPPDFVTGAAQPELATRISAVITALGCP